MKTLVFLGNCQLASLKFIYDRLIAPHEIAQTRYFVDYTAVDESRRSFYDSADVLIYQMHPSGPNIHVDHRPKNARCYAVPVVTGGFLWPYSGQAHPLHDETAVSRSPFNPQQGDSYLNRMLQLGVACEQAVASYRALDLNEIFDLDRLLQISVGKQRRLDAATGYAIADLIDGEFRDRQLFYSAYHPTLPVMRHLASVLFREMGVAEDIYERTLRLLRFTSMPDRELPIHPSVWRHFGLRYADANRGFQFMWQGRISFDDWVRRYMRFEWNSVLEEAITAVKDKRTEENLVEQLKRGLADAPESAHGYAALAQALLRSGRVEEARTALTESIALDQESPQTQAQFGHILFRTGDLDGSVRALRRAIDLDPGDVGFYLALANVLLQGDEPDKATLILQQALEVDPRNGVAHAQLGHTLVKMGKLPDATLALQKALELDSENPALHDLLSHVLGQLARPAEGVAAARRAVELAPDNALYRAHLGHLLMQLNELDEAEVCFRMAAELSPGNAEPLAHLAYLFARHGRREAAQDAIQRAIAIAPDKASYHSSLGHLLAQQGQTEASEAAFRRAIELSPDRAEDHNLHAQVLGRLGRIDEAIGAMHRAVALDPTNVRYEEHLRALESRRVARQQPVSAAAPEPELANNERSEQTREPVGVLVEATSEQ